MADCRHAPDTLFIVAEEDWRFYASDTAPELPNLDEPFATGGGRSSSGGLQELVSERGLNATIKDIYHARLRRCPLRGAGAEPATSADDEHEALAEDLPFVVRRRKPTPEELQELPQELTDLVRICTQAHRCGKGGLVWLGWDGADKAGCRRKPVHGALAFGITSLTARLMLEDFDEVFEFRHWD